MTLMSNLAAFRDRAVALGGHTLKPKRNGGKTSLAFTFPDRSVAEQFVVWAQSAGAKVSPPRGTYRACLVTAEV